MDGRLGIEQLLGQTEWLRALARHLAGEAGDDLAQEVWVAAQLAPPDPARPPRPWLARVLRNLLHTRRRDDGRRVRRQRAYQRELPDRAAAVDEVYERLALQRFVAEQVMALEEPLRTTVLLRYFEGLDSSRIAVLMAAPPGTVRWRLKVALERLRTALDERGAGERRAWVPVLVPRNRRALPATGGVIMGQVKAGTAMFFCLLMALVLAGAGVLWRRGRVPAGVAAVPRAAAVRVAGARTVRRLPGPFLVAPGEIAACRNALARAIEEAQGTDEEARRLVPAAAFEGGAPNPPLRERVARDVDRLLGGTLHELVCRGWACRLDVVVPRPDGDEVQPRLAALGAWIGSMKEIEKLPLGPAPVQMQWAGSSVGEDPIAHRKLERYVFYFGAPAAMTAVPAELPPPPATLDECRSRLAAVEARVERRRAELAGFRPPSVAFAQGAPDPALARQVLAKVGQAGAPVECRASVCRLRAADRVGIRESLGAVIRKEEVVGDDLYLTIGDDGGVALQVIREPARSPAFFAGCPQPERPGNVLLRILVPATGAANDDGAMGHASVRLEGGSLAGTAAAACLTGRMAAMFGEAHLPTPVGGLLRYESWTWSPGETPRLSTAER